MDFGHGILSEAEIKAGLGTLIFGRKIYSLTSVESTNALALKMAEEGTEEGTLVVAEEQTRGRGRMGRQWHSPPGVGIWSSLILRPRLLSHQAPCLTLMAGLAVARAIRSSTGLPAALRWPNDVLIGGRKACGILTEMGTRQGQVEYCVVGLGLNVNQSQTHFPPSLRLEATSIRTELGREVSRIEILQRILTEFERLYLRQQKEGFSPILEESKRLSTVLGKWVSVRQGLHVYHGKAVDIDHEGALMLESEQGRHRIFAGDVSLIEGDVNHVAGHRCR